MLSALIFHLHSGFIFGPVSLGKKCLRRTIFAGRDTKQVEAPSDCEQYYYVLSLNRNIFLITSISEICGPIYMKCPNRRNEMNPWSIFPHIGVSNKREPQIILPGNRCRVARVGQTEKIN